MSRSQKVVEPEMTEAPVTEDGPRLALLEEGVRELGERWVEAWCEQLRKEGRPIMGGWPGTLPEARARVMGYLAPEFGRRGLPRLTPSELGWAARATYAKARRIWLTHAESDE